MVTKQVMKKRVLIGVGLSIVAFFLSKLVVAKYYKKKAIGKTSNFVNLEGDSGDFRAKSYDPNHKNSDGSLGATFISFNDSDVVGFWYKGKLEIGTPFKV